jgi:C2H2-type zinc finger
MQVTVRLIDFADVVGNFKLFSDSANKQPSDVESKAMATKKVSSISQDAECSTSTTSQRKVRMCTMCDVQFDSRVKLRKHMYKVHGVEKDVSSPDSHLKRKNKGDAGGYECKVCGRLFQKQQSLAAHCIIHTGDRPYPCRRPGCSKSFRQNSTRLSHEKSQHSEMCSFVCSFCGEGFELYNLLQAHADLEHDGIVDAKVQSTDGVSVKGKFYTVLAE